MNIAFYNKSTDLGLIPNIVASLIAFVSGGKHAHCELVFSSGRSFSMGMTSLKARFTNFYEFTGIDWNEVNLPLSPDQEKSVLTYCGSKVGTKYDWLGALFSPLKSCAVQSNERLFCSEVVVDALRTVEPYAWLNKGCTYTPAALYKVLTEPNPLNNREAYIAYVMQDQYITDGKLTYPVQDNEMVFTFANSVATPTSFIVRYKVPKAFQHHFNK